MRFLPHLFFRMIRHTSRFNIILTSVSLCVLLLTWNRCQHSHSNTNKDMITDNKEAIVGSEEYETEQSEGRKRDIRVENRESEEQKSIFYKTIDVLVNGENTIQGRIEGDEVYIPFNFIKDYFEIEGQITADDFGQKLEWKHTSYEYFTPSTRHYDPAGPFLWFVNYNVERRARVKCITGMDEVPISTQWGPKGYYYPIQIAQYGLSHYSVLKSDMSSETRMVVENCEGPKSGEWSSETGGSFKKVFHHERRSNVMHFDATDSVVLSMTNSGKSQVLSFDILFQTPGSVSLVLEVDDTKEKRLVYETTNEMLKVKKEVITYGIGGEMNKWRRITRHLRIDLQKGLTSRGKREKQKKPPKIRISEIQKLVLRGKGFIDNITLAETAHEAAFLASARWLLSNQDKNGGWAAPVKRKIKNGPELEPGWYSAMAQGQAMSVLTRAFHLTNNEAFLKAAEHATSLFRVKSQDHGILAIYLDRYKWYEEYPLTPSLFVLNGFIYSLMGLYDLKSSLPEARRSEAEELFKDGMTSLRAMIQMFDGGHGTIYDLRHLTIDHEPNLARWDYHVTHVNQLYWITMIDPDPFYKTILERWKGYFKGLRAKHN